MGYPMDWIVPGGQLRAGIGSVKGLPVNGLPVNGLPVNGFTLGPRERIVRERIDFRGP